MVNRFASTPGLADHADVLNYQQETREGQKLCKMATRQTPQG